MDNKRIFHEFFGRIAKFFGDKSKTFLYELVKINSFSKGKVLVISPHFDDEIIGCGGALIKEVSAGSEVHVVYLTDGRIGIPDIKNKKLVYKIRKNESLSALKVIGIKNSYFLNEVEGSAEIKSETIKSFRKIMHEVKPDKVYLPWFLDNHRDHIKSNKILLEVCKDYGFSFNICAYEVWTPLFPNLILDLRDVYDTKKKALLCFKSQLKYNNYMRAISGLNQYRSMQNLDGNSYAEAFIFLPARQYFNFFVKT